MHAEPAASVEPASHPLTATAGRTAPAIEASLVPAPAEVDQESPEADEHFQLPLEKHLWTKFLPGSWREVEITTEVFNQAGESLGQSVARQREVLQAISDDSYMLQVMAAVDYPGDTVDAAPTTRALKILTDRGGQIFQYHNRPDELVRFGERDVSTKVWDVIHTDESRNLRQRIYYTPDHFPYILQRDIFENDDITPVEQVPIETTLVITRQIPYCAGNTITPCVGVRTLRRHSKGSSEVLQLLNPSIPGGEAVSWTTDFDAEDRPMRWTVQKTVDYGSADTELQRVPVRQLAPGANGSDAK